MGTNPLDTRPAAQVPANQRALPLTLDVEAASVVLGGDASIRARVFDAAGVLQPATGVVWSSSDRSAVTVTDGRVAGLRIGAATVWARIGTDSVSALVAVEPAGTLEQIEGSRSVSASTSRGPAGIAATSAEGDLSSSGSMRWLAISSGVTAMVAGQTRQFEARAWTAAYHEVVDAGIVWESSAPSVIAVDADGDVTALREGSAVITARATTGGADAPFSAVVVSAAPPTRDEVAVTSVVVSPTFVSLAPNKSAKLTGTARGPSGEALTGRDINWTTSNALVATVSDAGIVRAVGGGTAIVTAESEGRTAPAMIRVSGPGIEGVARVDLTPTTADVYVGSQVQLTAEPKSATNVTLAGRTVAYTSSNPAVATVSSTGLVSALAAGSATITAVSETAASSAVITVLATPAVAPPTTTTAAAVVANVTVSLNSGTLAVGQSTQAVAQPKDASGTVVADRAVVWASSAPRVAHVSASGLVTADSTGTTTITATVDGKVGSAVLTVGASGTVSIVVANITVVLNATALAVGENTQAVATPLSAGGTVLDRATSWASSAPTIATVSATGIVTAVSAGAATITASVEGKSGSASVTVTVPTVAPPSTSIAAAPELPRVFLDTRYQAPTGRTIAVSAGANLQTVLDTAKYGDLILLQAGATFTGNFRLVPKSGTGRITIRTNTSLPAEGERMTPAKAGNLAKLLSPNSNPALTTEGRSNGYRIVGVEIGLLPSVTLAYNIVSFGVGLETSEADLPSDLVLDRSYVHGHPTSDISRCVALNGVASAVIDSYLSECHGKGRDAQAIGGWNGAGPFKIVNNFLEGSGENLMFGGGATRIANLVPSDIEIRGNHFYKPMEWLTSGTWAVKNLLELKSARRVLIDGNVLENCWVHGQVGFAVVMYSSNEGDLPWNIVSDVTFSNNIVRNSAGAVNVSAGYTNVQAARRFAFVNNLFEKIGDTRLGSNGRMFSLLNNLDDVTVSHNTFVYASGAAKHSAVMLDGLKPSRFVYTNNVTEGFLIVPGNAGTAGLDIGVNGWTMAGNVMSGMNAYYASIHPTGNHYPATVNDVGFQNWLAGDVRLGALSSYKLKSTEGRDPGVDYATLIGKTSGVVQP